MITADDIQAFEEYNRGNMDAADEFLRRAEKGLPSDRWANGHAGCVQVARGIKAKNRMLELYAEFALGVMHGDAARTAAEMEATRDPMRND